MSLALETCAGGGLAAAAEEQRRPPPSVQQSAAPEASTPAGPRSTSPGSTAQDASSGEMSARVVAGVVQVFWRNFLCKKVPGVHMRLA